MSESTAYPKTLSENLKYRAKALQEAETNLALREMLLDQCRRDRLYWFNVFLYTYDPRRDKIKTVPFITYPFQDDILLWDADVSVRQVDSLVEKSRDMGCTWMFVGNDLYDFLFSAEKIEIRWGSRKEDYVDKRGDMDSIFEKFRFALRLLPDWMRPAGFTWQEHDNHMRLINPATGSSITGEATNQNFGRGGRKHRIRFDEFAFWECADGAWAAAADSTNCRTALSTPNGAANKFAELAGSEIEKRAIHWTQHPEKNRGAYILSQSGDNTDIYLTDDPNAAYSAWKEYRLKPPPQNTIGGWVRSPWYDMQCNRRGSQREIAEELDIDYTRSGLPFFDLVMLAKQVPCSLTVRTAPTGQIPADKYVLGDIVEMDSRYQFRESPTGFLRVFSLPVREGQYVVGGDVAEGLAKGDRSFMVVRDRYSGDVVAAGHGTWEPDYFEILIYKTARYYNNAIIACENNNHGYTVNNGLKGRDCNLYWTKRTTNGKTTRVKPGFTTTAVSRPLMLDQAREDIRKFSCLVRDPEVLKEMGTFVFNENNAKPEAAGDFHDDGVIAFSIAGQVLREYPYRAKKPVEKRAPIATEKNGKFSFGRR